MNESDAHPPSDRAEPVDSSAPSDRAEPVDSSVELAGIPLRNPVLTASGTFGYGTEFAPFLDLRRSNH